jgi:hypothetical protein
MIPKTWTEVLIERANWHAREDSMKWTLSVCDLRHASAASFAVALQTATAHVLELSLLRPCEACHDGWMDSAGYPGYRHPCQICHGSGIAPEGDDK